MLYKKTRAINRALLQNVTIGIPATVLTQSSKTHNSGMSGTLDLKGLFMGGSISILI